MRPRKHNRNLPACVYLRHGAYYHVRNGKWQRLGTDLRESLAEYARIIDQPKGGMANLIDEAMPGILKGKADQTKAQYKVAARRLKEALKDFAPQQVTARDVAQIRRALAESPATANRTITVLRMVFDYALEEELVDANPCYKVKRLQQEARTRRITPTEYRAIYRAAPPRLQAVMDLCYLTGQRIGDVLSIKRTDLHEGGIYVQQQKTGKRLVIEWTPELKAACEAAKALHGPVAVMTLVKGLHGRPMTYTMAWKDWRAACLKAGVVNANIHDLRAMSGTEAKAQGKDARGLLGHTDEKTTRTYLRDKEIPLVQGPSFGQKR